MNTCTHYSTIFSKTVTNTYINYNILNILTQTYEKKTNFITIYTIQINYLCINKSFEQFQLKKSI